MSDLVIIKFLNGPRASERVRLDHYPTTFGRTSDSHVVLAWDGLVSSRHFEIYVDEGALFLQDSGSRNGTRINGSPILRQRLYSGDVIEVGNTQLQISIEAQSASVTTSPSISNEDSPISKENQGEKPTAAGRINPFDSISSEFQLEAEVPKHPVDAPQMLQQVRLRISDQSLSGLGSQGSSRLFWLSPGQQVVFGRSPRCDCSIEADSLMSSTHFKVVCDSQQCILEDLGSKSGTILNDVAVSSAAIFHGDRVLAGSTEFEIEVDGTQGPLLRTEAAKAAVAAAVPVELPSPLSQSLELTRERSPSGVFVLTGFLQDQIPLHALLSWLRSSGKFYLLMDTARGSIPLPENFDATAGQLFYWLPPEFAGLSPQLVELDELVEWQGHINDLFGNDGLVVMQSEVGKQQLLSEWRACLTGTSDTKKPFQGIVGICWPSVLTATLLGQAEVLPKKLIQTVSLLIAEAMGGKSYQIFASQPGVLDKILGTLDRRQIAYSINRKEESE